MKKLSNKRFKSRNGPQIGSIKNRNSKLSLFIKDFNQKVDNGSIGFAGLFIQYPSRTIQTKRESNRMDLGVIFFQNVHEEKEDVPRSETQTGEGNEEIVKQKIQSMRNRSKIGSSN